MVRVVRTIAKTRKLVRPRLKPAPSVCLLPIATPLLPRVLVQSVLLCPLFSASPSRGHCGARTRFILCIPTRALPLYRVSLRPRLRAHSESYACASLLCVYRSLAVAARAYNALTCASLCAHFPRAACALALNLPLLSAQSLFSASVLVLCHVRFVHASLHSPCRLSFRGRLFVRTPTRRQCE